MATEQASLLPLHHLLGALDLWRQIPTDARRTEIATALGRLAEAYGARGAELTISGSQLPNLECRSGSLAGARADTLAGLSVRKVRLGPAEDDARLVVDGEPAAVETLVSAIELAVSAVWSRHEADSQRQQLEALDTAVRGIAGIMAVDRVLQLIVDRVRDLAGAQYAALGIVGQFGGIDQFITSGVSDAERARIGHLPRGLGLLGLIIKEDRPFLVDDIATDPRRHGFPEHHPEMHAFLGVPIRNKGQLIGNLYLTNKLTRPVFSAADLHLVEMFALHAGIAIENARLHDEVGRLAIVEERERISQDLHDSVIQSLYAISLSLEDLPDVISEDPTEGAARADRAIESIHSTIRDIRNFIMGLQPELLVDGDLSAGVEMLAAEFRANTLIDLELHMAAELPTLNHDLSGHLLAITREALSNIARHSDATRATLDLSLTADTVRLVIGDNGRGFDVGRPRSSLQHGLVNLRARAEAVGGQLKVTSEAGAGTQLEADIPLGGDSAQ